MIKINIDSLAAWVRISPSTSFSIEVPSIAMKEYDDRVLSIWKPNENDVIQFSSYRREVGAVGERTNAAERLATRQKQDNLNFSQIQLELSYADYAAAVAVDEKKLTWLYVYVTWPHLAIFVTILGDGENVLQDSHWTRRVLKSILVTL